MDPIRLFMATQKLQGVSQILRKMGSMEEEKDGCGMGLLVLSEVIDDVIKELADEKEDGRE